MTGRHQAGPVMSPTQERLTFLDNNTLLIISSLGLACVVTVMLWVARTLDWRRTVGLDRENDGDPALLGPRTRVIPGGREAAKAARKEAKKRAKAEFKRSRQSSSNQQRRNRLLVEKNRRGRDGLATAGKGGHEKESHDRSIDVSRKLEDYLLNHKVSHSRNLADELGVAPAEIVHRIMELEKEGKCSWIVVEDTQGGSSFVRIRADEMRAIASFVNDKGRLTVEELAAEANRVLQLPGAPKTDFNPEEKHEGHMQKEENGAKGAVGDENAEQVLNTP